MVKRLKAWLLAYKAARKLRLSGLISRKEELMVRTALERSMT